MKLDNALIWLSPIVCLPRRCGDLDDISAVIEDISQDHPDRMPIVIALNAERCPDCDAHGLDYKPRVGNVFSMACDQGFNVTPGPPKVYFVQRIGRRPRA